MQEYSKTSPATIPMKHKEEDLFRSIINYASINDYSVALWRLPDTLKKNIILSYSPTLNPTMDSLEEFPEGFLFTPFNKQKDNYFLKADLSFSFTEDSLAEAYTPLQTKSHQKLQEITQHDSKKTIPFIRKNPLTNFSSNEKDRFEEFVKQCINQIEVGSFEKVVPSRCKVISLSDSFDVIEAFQRLCLAYPNAMISLVTTPTLGTWIGASPEILVSVENKNTFSTVALAGTKMYEDGINLKNVSWTQKEIEEQALVSRYIINNFKKIRLREFEEHGPKTVVAGNLVHLKTEFTVDMKATNFPQLGSVMLNLLHPTSAVCGMPLEPALKFLNQNEGYDREFYSGFLGPVNFENNIHLFVNLRCMQLFEKQAIMYAGAGVTRDSVPEAEWEETEMKFNTLLKVIV